MNAIITPAITADSVAGRTLLALRAGPMTHGELNERFPGGHQSAALARAGLLEETESGWRITDAGRAACPLRNPKAAADARAVPLAATPARIAATSAISPAASSPIHRTTPQIPSGDNRMASSLHTPTATDKVRRLLICHPEGLARKDIIKRTALSDASVDNAIVNLIKAGDATRKSYGVIAPTPDGVSVMTARVAASEAFATASKPAVPEPAKVVAEALPSVKVVAEALPPAAEKPSDAIDFAVYDDGRLVISEGDEIFVLPPAATRRLGQFLGRIEVGGWPAHF